MCSNSQRQPVLLWLVLLLPISTLVLGAATEAETPRSRPDYEYRKVHDRDGIGKFYFGREIAHVMGHRGADWLERDEREREERPDLLLKALEIQPGDTVADIGAGTGFFSRRLGRLVGEKGRVLAVDIQPEMIELLKRNLAEAEIENVKPILGTEQNPKLPPNTVDLVLMVDVYHEFEYPFEMIQAIVSALKPGGRIAFVEYRAEDPAVPIKRLHKMSEEQVRREMSVQPLKWQKTIDVLPRQHIILFAKPVAH